MQLLQSFGLLSMLGQPDWSLKNWYSSELRQHFGLVTQFQEVLSFAFSFNTSTQIGQQTPHVFFCMRKRQVGSLPCLENCCRFNENKRKEMFIFLYISLLILATCETAFLRTVCIWSDRAVLCLFTLKMCVMSSAPLLCSWETPRSWYIQIPGSCYSYRNFSVADLKKSIENAQVEQERCRP